MSNKFGLFFLTPSKDDPLFGKPIACVFLKGFSQADRPAKGLPLLSAQALTLREFDEQIDWLIDDLEKIRREAKTKFMLNNTESHL